MMFWAFFLADSFKQKNLRGGEEMKNKPNLELKTILFKRGITQRQLSFGTGIDEGLISKAIRYGMATAEMRERIADYLNVNQSDIFVQRNY